ncbi:serologically defined colon cancer antigen 8 homolog isoform X1 [Rhynchophorus ferrugineus]|uniref:serologically defined colon cancer antigen 8 homolog isoform X1 n=2 Tax=Rhynchophorus ferrugineus TaxID=354439 RepID=UPI003FCC93CB
MYNTGGSTTKKQRPNTGYLVRPKLGALRSLYSNRPISALSNEKRKKFKKGTMPKMDFRRKPDYADTAYREAVGRLRILLAESYTPVRSRIYSSRPHRELDSGGEETDNQSVISGVSRTSRLTRPYYSYNYTPSVPRKLYYPPLKSNISTLHTETAEKNVPQEPVKFDNVAPAPPELMSFIERQEDYIEQLEKESRFCKDELSSLLSKVKEVISENEHLHEKQKTKLIKSVFDHLETETETETEFDVAERKVSKSPKKTRITKLIDGPAIVFESRISELEAQLTQSKIDLKKSQEDNEVLRQKLSDGSYFEGATYDNLRKQVDGCNREKEELQEKIKSLQSALSKLRDKENDTCDQVKRSLDVAEQAQYEKSAAELEIRRLKDELERQHLKLRDAIADQSRRISDERSAVERRYTQQIEQLTAEVGVQWETTNKLQLELDKQRRENTDFRRECAQKQALIDELKKDMQNKILTLQSDIGVTGAEKSALEQQISTLNMSNERTERQYKQEITRLQAEIQSLRQRLDRADADLIHSRRENIRLTEQVASLEKEINLNSALNEERSKSTTPRSSAIMPLPPPTPKPEDREKELTSMIHDMENKHAATVAELESMIQSQNQLMDKLSSECHALTRKLDDASHRHKEEIRELQTSLDLLNNRFSQTQYATSNVKDEGLPAISNKRITPTSQTPSTSPRPESQSFARSESRSSLINKSKTNSRQPSREKLSPAVTESQQDLHLDQVKDQIQLENYSSDAPDTQQYATQQDQDYKQADNQQYGQEQYMDHSNEYDPNQQYASQPNQQYNESDGQYQYDPNMQYDPNQQYSDPNQQYNNPNQVYDPNQEYDPNQQYDPNQHYDPNQAYTDENNYAPSGDGQVNSQYYDDQNQYAQNTENAPESQS